MDLFFIRDFDYYLLYTCVVADLHARAVTLAREEDEEPRRVGIERTAVAGFEKLDILRRVIRHNLLPCRIGRRIGDCDTSHKDENQSHRQTRNDEACCVSKGAVRGRHSDFVPGHA